MNIYDKNNFFWEQVAELPNNPYRVNANFSEFKCLLVHLIKEGDFSGHDYPIALGYMASLLRMNGGSARILIQCADQYLPEVFSGYDLICFYPMSILLRPLLDLTLRIKNDYPETKICLFNSEQHQHEMVLCAPKAADFGHALMEEFPSIDFILTGEAEGAFIKLCKKLADKTNDFAEVPSCLYRQARRIELSKRDIEPVKFRYLPFPSRDLLEKSISPEGVNSRPSRIQSSRGCISNCLFCVESASNITKGGRKKSWLGRDICRFVDEIQMLWERYKVVFFNIIDSSFEDPGKRGLERVKRFCEEIVNRDIEVSFKVHFRMDTFDKFDDDFLQFLKEAGVDILVVGAESGVDEELKSYRKITTARKNIDNIRRLDKFGKFFNLLGHMMFSPYVGLNDLIEKVKFLKDINRGWDYLNMSNNLLAFRGTAWHEYIRKDGLAREPEKLSSLIPYHYRDERVKLVADEIGALRNRCPEVILLQNLLYDALNISARYYNKMNRHLWGKEALFQEFRGYLNALLAEVEEIYCGYFLDLVELAGENWTIEKKDALFCNWIPASIPKCRNRVKAIIENYINGCKKAGLSTSRLYLKTWMSLINKGSNTSSGVVEAA